MIQKGIQNIPYFHCGPLYRNGVQVKFPNVAHDTCDDTLITERRLSEARVVLQ